MTVQTTDKVEKLLTSAQVSDMLHISKRTLRRWCERKIINYIVFRKGFRFRPSAIQIFIDRHVERYKSNGTKGKKVNPVSPLSRLKKGTNVLNILTDEEAQAFFNGCEKDQDGNIILRGMPIDPDD